MENSNDPINSDDLPQRPIHEDFYSLYEGRPFRICTSCGESLVEFDEGYIISKVYHGDEVIMEAALCRPCHIDLTEGFSKESVEAITEWQMTHARERENDPDVNRYHCEFCEQTRDSALADRKQYQIAAICHGSAMIDRPIFACEECMLAMNEKLSEQTRRRWRDFVDDHFPGVPADSVPDPSTLPVF